VEGARGSCGHPKYPLHAYVHVRLTAEFFGVRMGPNACESVKPSEQAEYAVRTRRAQGRRCVERRTVDPPPLLVPPPAGGREDTGMVLEARLCGSVTSAQGHRCSHSPSTPLSQQLRARGRSSLYSREGMVVVRVKAQRVAPRRERREKALPRPLSTVP